MASQRYAAEISWGSGDKGNLSLKRGRIACMKRIHAD